MFDRLLRRFFFSVHGSQLIRLLFFSFIFALSRFFFAHLPLRTGYLTLAHCITDSSSFCVCVSM